MQGDSLDEPNNMLQNIQSNESIWNVFQNIIISYKSMLTFSQNSFKKKLSLQLKMEYINIPFTNIVKIRQRKRWKKESKVVIRKSVKLFYLS